MSTDGFSIPSKDDYNAALNSLNQHLDPNDLEGAWKDNNPDQVEPGAPRGISNGNHLNEVNNALEAVKTTIKRLGALIKHLDLKISGVSPLKPEDPDIPTMISMKDRFQKAKGAFEELQKFVRNIIKKGSPRPDTWTHQGKTPFGNDLLSASTCNTPKPGDYIPTNH